MSCVNRQLSHKEKVFVKWYDDVQMINIFLACSLHFLDYEEYYNYQPFLLKCKMDLIQYFINLLH